MARHAVTQAQRIQTAAVQKGLDFDAAFELTRRVFAGLHQPHRHERGAGKVGSGAAAVRRARGLRDHRAHRRPAQAGASAFEPSNT